MELRGNKENEGMGVIVRVREEGYSTFVVFKHISSVKTTLSLGRCLSFRGAFITLGWMVKIVSYSFGCGLM